MVGSKSLLLIAASLAALAPTAFAVLTPEDRANPSTGQISNPSFDEFYIQPIAAGNNIQGFMTGFDGSGTKASLDWYKFTSDGVHGIVIDAFGSTFAFGGGASLSGGKSSILAVYNSNGVFLASNEGVHTPSTGDSNVAPTAPADAYPLGQAAYRQPFDPTKPAMGWRNDGDAHGWVGNNSQNLSQLSFVNNAQANPNPTTPINPGERYPDWDEYNVLPAGTYWLAMVGYSSYFSGSPRYSDGINQFGASYPNSSGPVTNSTPYGFISFNASHGDYFLHVRTPGDMDLNGTVDTTDLAILKSKVALYAAHQGLINEGFDNGDPTTGTWLGLQQGAEQLRYDLTGNSRIDNHDIAQWSRWANIKPSIVGDTDLDGDVDFADLLTLAQNYGRAPADWLQGDFDFTSTVNFDDLLGLAQHYGTGVTGGLDFAADFAKVQSLLPEPTALSALAGAALIITRRKNRKPSQPQGASA